MQRLLFLSILILLSSPLLAWAAPPTVAVKFVILQPANSTVGTPVAVTIEAQKSNNHIDVNYQNDVTLVTSGSATGGGLVDIVNGGGTIEINDLVAETVTLSLTDSQATGLDINSTKQVTFSSSGGGGGGGGTAAWNQQKFWFRDDDGNEAAASGFGVESVSNNTNLINVSRGTSFRLRFALKLTGADGSIAPRLEFSAKDGEGADCAVGSFTAITPTSNNFNLWLSDNFLDGVPTTQQLVGGPNFSAGQILESTNPAPTLAMLKNQSTEYEWSLKASQDAPFATTYSFRITDNGTVLNTYDQCPSVTIQAEPPVPTGRPSTVNFSGKAFPGAQIFLVEKIYQQDVLLEQGIPVADNGEFKIGGLPTGYHAYSLLVKDAAGRQTQTKVYTMAVINDPLTVADILIAPTIDLTRAVVTQGDFIKVIGSAFPRNRVQVQLDNAKTYAIEADDRGNYTRLISTAELAFGQHSLRANQLDTASGRASDWSLTRRFVVSASTVVKADFNGDGKIDLQDWSIFLARWKSQNQADQKLLDLNHNGTVEISDLGIFLRSLKR